MQYNINIFTFQTVTNLRWEKYILNIDIIIKNFYKHVKNQTIHAQENNFYLIF